MKYLRYIPTGSLFLALIGMSPVMAENAAQNPSYDERTQPDRQQIRSPLGYRLSPDQLDKITGGEQNRTQGSMCREDCWNSNGNGNNGKTMTPLTKTSYYIIHGSHEGPEDRDPWRLPVND